MAALLDEAQAASLAGGDVLDVETARTVEDISADAVAAAEAEALAAERAATELELAALTDPGADPAEVVTQREKSRFARLRASLVARRAERSCQARRLLALDEVGADVDALAAAAAAPDRAVTQTARKLAEAAAALRGLARANDDQVAALAQRAKELGVEPAAPAGPRATSAHVVVSPDGGITHGRIRVGLIGERVDEAIAKAVGGDPDAAAAMLLSVRERPAVRRADAYYRSALGAIISMDGPVSDAFRDQLAKGQLVPLSASEIDRYLEGRLDGPDNERSGR